MKSFLKGLALSLLGLLLYISLAFLGLLFMLHSTVLNPHFVLREMEKLDVYSFVEEAIREEVVSQLVVPAGYEPYVFEVVDGTMADLRPWFKEKVRTVVYTGYDYFLGRSYQLQLSFSLEPVRDSLKDNLRDTVLSSPPPELAGLPPAATELFLDEANRQINEQIPDRFEFDQDTLDAESVEQMEQVRQYLGYLQLGYQLLIAFILLLILGIVLIHREVRGATRSLGITFLSCGVFIYLSNFLARYFLSPQLLEISLPADFQTKLPQLMADLHAPLDMYAIVLAAIGAALLVVSFVYKRRQSEL
jgi:hypothetical protein